MDDIYFTVRFCAWWLNLITFFILLWKYWVNNHTGLEHTLNWPAVGMVAGSFAYGYGTAEILYQPVQPGGMRVFVFAAAVVIWFFIAWKKIPLAKKIKGSNSDRV